MSKYSQLYIERGRPEPDSDRARVRLCALFQDIFRGKIREDAKRFLTRRLGVHVIAADDFFATCEIRDLLDTVTEVTEFIARYPDIANAQICHEWQSDVDQIFVEENLAYRVDDDAIVHPYVDQEFEINRTCALEALGDPKFDEARTDFGAAYRHLRGREYKQTIVMMSRAVEVAAKVLFPGAFSRLMPNEVDKQLKPRLEQRYAGNEPATKAGRLLLDGLKNWISATQLYRHGQEQQEAAEPPEDFVIAHLSAGATYLRWMIELGSR